MTTADPIAEARDKAAEAIRRGLDAARAVQNRTRAKPSASFDVEAFYGALDRRRRSQRIRWQDISEATGVPKSTFTRMGYGYRPDADNLIRLLVWLGDTDLKPYIREAK